ncbi:fasciclin domain-containing protein [Spirosoma sp.]|uniref:fasciclin domain-containing protein n=1 Tax=Spirosoma sp. TaxID=1899569 RepID=UPI003B3B595B
MKTKQMIHLLAVGVPLMNLTSLAQTTTNSANQGTRSGTSATPAAGQYRQSSAANGTAVNNSNSTNYNSNNVTNAPTGVGSNPSVTTDPTSLQGGASSDAAPRTPGASSTINEAPKTGTAPAVTGAKKAPTPAVVAGSTERNTSIHDFIASSPNYTTLQNALQSADLYRTLKENGPYTLFAPSNTAFKKMPASLQASLLEGRNSDDLKQLLSYHVVQGTIDVAELTKRIKTNGGKAQLQTIAGNTLVAELGANGRLTLTDERGKSVDIDAPDNRQSNGVVHGIDAVLLSKKAADSIR